MLPMHERAQHTQAMAQKLSIKSQKIVKIVPKAHNVILMCVVSSTTQVYSLYYHKRIKTTEI